MNSKSLWVKPTVALLVPVLVLGCGGSGTSAPRTHFVFIGNRTGSSITRAMVTSTGALVSLGPDTVTTFSPAGLATASNATSRFLYSTNFRGTLEQFSIDPGGFLRPLSPAAIVLPSGNYGIATTPDGKYLFATSGDKHVYQYVIGADGKLTFNATPSVAAGTNPDHIEISANGKFAYVSNYGDNTISCYTVGIDGTLTANGAPVSTGTATGPWTISLSNSGASMYVGCAGNNKVAQFTVATDGTIALKTPDSLAGPFECYAVAASPNTNFVYSASYGNPGEIWRFTADSSGSLTPLLPLQSTTMSNQWPLAFSPDGLLFVANQSSASVTVYGVNTSGALTLLGSQGTGSTPASFAFVPY